MLPSAYDQRPSLSSGPIVSWSECHNVVKFFRPESRIAFPFFIHVFPHSLISPFARVGTPSKLQNLAGIVKTHGEVRSRPTILHHCHQPFNSLQHCFKVLLRRCIKL